MVGARSSVARARTPCPRGSTACRAARARGRDRAGKARRGSPTTPDLFSHRDILAKGGERGGPGGRHDAPQASSAPVLEWLADRHGLILARREFPLSLPLRLPACTACRAGSGEALVDRLREAAEAGESWPCCATRTSPRCFASERAGPGSSIRPAGRALALSASAVPVRSCSPANGYGGNTDFRRRATFSRS